MIDFIKLIAPKANVLVSTAINHYMKGPPQPSWDLRFHLMFSILRSLIDSSITIEKAQQFSCIAPPLPADFSENQVVIPNEYRKRAQPYLEKILNGYEQVLDDEWKELKNDAEEMGRNEEKEDFSGNKKWLGAKWIYLRERGFERKANNKRVVLYLHGGAYFMCNADSHRAITTRIAREADALVFAISYRLAPQHQFPAAVHDALAAYLYLTNPPEDAGFEAIDPKQIVVMGDSAGGGLTMALGLAIRDAGLPMVAGLVGWSPWVDLTHSMPSILSPNLTDYIPIHGFVHKPSPAFNDFLRKSDALSRRIKKENRPQFWDSSFNRDKRIQLYAPNEVLSVPYVSPMCAESLAGLPPMLVQTGDGERIRDEIIYFSFKASQPEKYTLPSYNAEKFRTSPFRTPTNVTLEIYQDMPHVFQVFDFSTSSKVAFKNSVEFIRNVIDKATNQTNPKISDQTSSSSGFASSLNFTESTYSLISSTGETLPLEEQHYSVLKWTDVGKVPLVEKPIKPSPTNSDLYFFVYLTIAIAAFAYHTYA